MTPPTFLSPERVREIALEAYRSCSTYGLRPAEALGQRAIEFALPEIARAALELAAKRLDDLTFGVEIDEWAKMSKKEVSARACRECAGELRQMAKEITDAK